MLKNDKTKKYIKKVKEKTQGQSYNMIGLVLNKLQ